MKVEQKKEFNPVVITIESEQELNLFRQMVRDARYGITECGTAGEDNALPHDNISNDILDVIGWQE